MHDLKFAVLGAGHGGKAVAAHLAIKGYTVNLYNRTSSRIQAIKKMKGIELEGEVKGFGKLNVITSDIEKAIKGVDIIMVVVPADAHYSIAKLCAPVLDENQIVVLNPGRTCGALEFLNVLRSEGNKKDVTVAEAQTFIYASRGMGPATAKIFRIKHAIPVAAIPARKTEMVVKKLNEAFPEFIPAVSAIETSFNNIGAVFHPSITILNLSRIEATMGNFQFYIEGVTQSVAKILEAVDEERMKVAKSLKCASIYSAIEWLSMAYNVVEDNLFDAIHSNPGYVGIMAPRTINVRYITEDVPMSLVPISEFGRMFGVETKVIDSLINIANSIFKKDFRSTGRNLKKLGLEGLSLKEIRDIFINGR
ncbi:MAG: NAD/NADP octopine/nopaline dehydrogenase family protein [Candidatus Humimicrobiaceae bacterium]|jgi:opine dehydrogenase|nr:NAD/NADP octopine/nopaline dehydrogenase family protein [Candidatus Humimicrobiaceae bacterium]